MKNISRRKWLNSNKYLSAFILTDVSVHGHGVSGNINISDCSRKITLDFFSVDSKEFKNNLNKINTLLTEISIFKTNFLKARQHYKTTITKEKQKKGKKNDKD